MSDEQGNWAQPAASAEEASHESRTPRLQNSTTASRALRQRPSQRDQKRDESPAPHYPSVEVWVNSWLLQTWTRPMGSQSTTWCPQWWRHAEAVSRLTSLWLAWEHLRMDAGTGMSVWWRDHADVHLNVLLSTSGPFKGCEIEGHTRHPVPHLPSEPAPPGEFTNPA